MITNNFNKSKNFRYIPGTNKMYGATKNGDIYSFYHGKITRLKPGYCSSDKNGNYRYMCVNVNRKVSLVHRLVAEAWLPVSENDKKNLEVNHKDQNPYNNCVDNLEWCTPKYNCNYGDRRYRRYKYGKSEQVTPVVQLHNGEIKGIYISMADAAKAIAEEKGVPEKVNSIKTAINYVILGYPHHNTVYGYTFRMATDEEIESIDDEKYL